MRKFEFRLSRVLEFRQQELDLEQSRLYALLSQQKSLEEEEALLKNQLAEARDEAFGNPQLSGSSLQTLAQFQRYVVDRCGRLETQKAELAVRVRGQQARIVEAERRVNLLLKLKDRKQDAWTIEQEKELESLAADSFLAKLSAKKRVSAACCTDAKIRN